MKTRPISGAQASVLMEIAHNAKHDRAILMRGSEAHENFAVLVYPPRLKLSLTIVSHATWRALRSRGLVAPATKVASIIIYKITKSGRAALTAWLDNHAERFDRRAERTA